MAARTRRAKPVTLDDLAAAGVGTRRHLTGRTLSVHDDNYRWLPDGSVVLVLTDPPFNIAQDTNFHSWDGNTINSYRFDQDKGWDSHTPERFIDLLHQWSGEIARVLRPGGSFAVFCADAYLSHLIGALEQAGLNPRRTVTWRKPNAVPVNRKTMMMSACEYVVVGVKGRNATFNADVDVDTPDAVERAGGHEPMGIEPVLAGDKAAWVVERAVRDAVARVADAGDTRPDAIARAVTDAVVQAASEAGTRTANMYTTGAGGGTYLRGCIPNHVACPSKSGNRLHPTEKPVPLLRYLALLLSRPGDLILDPFAGSGSTGCAAISINRRCILVETDEGYFRKLSQRLGGLDSPGGPDAATEDPGHDS